MTLPSFTVRIVACIIASAAVVLAPAAHASGPNEPDPGPEPDFDPAVPGPPDPLPPLVLPSWAPEETYEDKLTTSGVAFEWGMSVAGTARWIPSGYMIGGRATVRLGTNHEVFFEVGKLELFCSNDYTGYFAGYQYVGRANSILRTYTGPILGYAHLNTNNSCPGFTPESATYAALLVAGLRLEPIPMIGFFAEALGGLTSSSSAPLMVAAGGGLQFALPF